MQIPKKTLTSCTPADFYSRSCQVEHNERDIKCIGEQGIETALTNEDTEVLAQN